MSSVGVVGAGLVGCLTALAFASKGHSVHLFDYRNDPRLVPELANLRSINLAVSARGIEALRYVDSEMADRILQHVIPMYGRMIHDLQGNQEAQVYGLFGESINSIDRSYLNKILLDEVAQADVKILFGHKLTRIASLDTPVLTFETNDGSKDFEFDYIVGADGAHSHFRSQLQRYTRMDFKQKYIDMQYMELSIPPGEGGSFSISPNHLHIWPRHNYMLIALSNQDGSFTLTFFSPWDVIESIKSSEEFVDFFRDNFPDAYDLIGEESLVSCYDKAPRGSLMQVEAYPYHSPNGRAVIVGDAAHSMVPFYGQGMNCGFEDVHVLMKLLDSTGDVAEAFKQYSPERKQDLRAICKLAMDNYYEMSSKVTSPLYLLRKRIDYVLGRYGTAFFQWIPMYTMISFRADIKYSDAVKINERQNRILQQIQWGTFAAGAAVVAAQVAKYWKK